MAECLICFSTIDDDKIVLECGHPYHYECIHAAYKHTIESKSLTRKNLRMCPYCREPGGFLPLKDNMIPERYIHKEWVLFMKLVHDGELEEYKKYMDEKKCMAICTTGINKDKQCKNNPKENGFCKRHQKCIIKTF